MYVEVCAPIMQLEWKDLGYSFFCRDCKGMTLLTPLLLFPSPPPNSKWSKYMEKKCLCLLFHHITQLCGLFYHIFFFFFFYAFFKMPSPSTVYLLCSSWISPISFPCTLRTTSRPQQGISLQEPKTREPKLSLYSTCSFEQIIQS